MRKAFPWQDEIMGMRNRAWACPDDPGIKLQIWVNTTQIP